MSTTEFTAKGRGAGQLGRGNKRSRCLLYLWTQHKPVHVDELTHLCAHTPNFKKLLFVFIVCWGGAKEHIRTPLIQHNSQVFLSTLLHLGSLHLNTPLKPQITIFWQQKCSSLRGISLRTGIGTYKSWLPALWCQILPCACLLYIIAISCTLCLCCWGLLWHERKHLEHKHIKQSRAAVLKWFCKLSFFFF